MPYLLMLIKGPLIISRPVSENGKQRVNLPVTKIKLKDVISNKDNYCYKR